MAPRSALLLAAALLLTWSRPAGALNPPKVLTTFSDFGANGNEESGVEVVANAVERAARTAGIGPWTAARALPQRRMRHAAVSANGYLYVLGGCDAGSGTGEGCVGPISQVVFAAVAADGSLG